MLLQMRTFTRSWVAYALLFVLAMMFVVFLGNGQSVLSALQFAGSNNLAVVNGQAVRPRQLSRELDLFLRGQRNQGQQVTQEQAIEAGVHLRLLESIIGRTAARVYAEKLGVIPSHAQVAERIRVIPAVQNPVTGAFDETAYDAFLRDVGYTRAEFEDDVRGEISTQMLLEAMVAGIRAPTSFGELAYVYDGESRVVTIAEAPGSAAGNIPAPTEEQLQTLWEQSQEQLRTPEFRALTLVSARPEDFISRVTVPEEQLREEFEARRPALAQPERRSYVRITAQTEAQANDAAARLGRGEALESIASALGVQTARGQNETRDGVTDAAVAEAVFGTAPRSAPRVVRGQLSPFVVVRVEAVQPAVQPDYAAMREDLRLAIAADEAADLLNAAVSAFEDARGAGTPIADAARQQGLTVTQIAGVDAQGRDMNGAPIETLAGADEVLTTAFATAEGEASDFIPLGDADVIISVDRIIPSRVRALDEVRNELAQSWIARERASRLRALGERVREAVGGGSSFAQAARAARFNVVVNAREITRRDAAQIPARGLAAQIFNAREGEIVTELRADGGAVLVAWVEHIRRVDPAAAPQAVEANRAQMGQVLTQSFGEAVQADIVARGRARRNDALIERLYPRGAAADDAQ